MLFLGATRYVPGTHAVRCESQAGNSDVGSVAFLVPLPTERTTYHWSIVPGLYASTRKAEGMCNIDQYRVGHCL
jgi:hypothetical protein